MGFARTSAAVAAFLLAVASPTAAAAATAPAVTAAPAVKVFSGLCPDGYVGGDRIAVAQRAGGKAQGFLNFRGSQECGDRVYSLEGSGTIWRAEPTDLNGRVVDVAADAKNAYRMYISEGTDPDTAEVRYGIRLPSGEISGSGVPMGPADPDHPQDGMGSMVAHDGAFLAVWPQYADGQYRLHLAGSMFGEDVEGDPCAIGCPAVQAVGTHPDELYAVTR